MVVKPAQKVSVKGPSKKQPLRFTLQCSADVLDKDIVDFVAFVSLHHRLVQALTAD